MISRLRHDKPSAVALDIVRAHSPFIMQSLRSTRGSGDCASAVRVIGTTSNAAAISRAMRWFIRWIVMLNEAGRKTERIRLVILLLSNLAVRLLTTAGVGRDLTGKAS